MTDFSPTSSLPAPPALPGVQPSLSPTGSMAAAASPLHLQPQPEGTAARGGSWCMVLAMALSGTIGLLVVESGLPVLWVVALRCLLGGLGLALWLGLSRQWLRSSWHEARWLLVGAVALIANWLCLFRAYHYSGIAIATVVYHVQPFLWLLLAAWVLREALPLRRLPWLGLALVGVVLSSGALGAGVASAASWAGMALALLAASLYAVATLATQCLKRLPPAQIAMLQMAMGAALLLPWAWALQGNAVFHAQAWASVLVLGLVHTAWMYTLMYAAFQRLPAQAIAGLSFIYPVMALLVDLLWFGLRPQPLQWLGMALILGAVWAYRRSAQKSS